MTDEIRRPNTKRRNWFLGGMLLFLVSVAGWWDWPRGDSRFIGDWDLIDDNLNQKMGRIALHANGRGSSSSRTCERLFSWDADDTRLSFSSLIEFVPAGEKIDQLTWELRSGGGNRPAFDVVEIHHDAIELQLPGSNRMRTLRRRADIAQAPLR